MNWKCEWNVFWNGVIEVRIPRKPEDVGCRIEVKPEAIPARALPQRETLVNTPRFRKMETHQH